MGSISASGTGSATRIGALQTFARRLGAALIIVGLLPAATSGTRVDVNFENVRSSKGLIRACLTRTPAYFPHCEIDPDARKQSIPAAPGAHISFDGVPQGDYAIAALHDENGNGKADMRFGIPREGVGFSQNPRIIMSAPSFDAARFTVGATPLAEPIRMKYFL